MRLPLLNVATCVLFTVAAPFVTRFQIDKVPDASPAPLELQFSESPHWEKDCLKVSVDRINRSSTPPYLPLGGLFIDTSVRDVPDPPVVPVDVRNIGHTQGDEVAQLYVHQPYGTSSRPVRELKGFKRISLALGKSTSVTVSLTENDLAYWSGATRNSAHDSSNFDVWGWR
jgi:hypothetical protein